MSWLYLLHLQLFKTAAENVSFTSLSTVNHLIISNALHSVFFLSHSPITYRESLLLCSGSGRVCKYLNPLTLSLRSFHIYDSLLALLR